MPLEQLLALYGCAGSSSVAAAEPISTHNLSSSNRRRKRRQHFSRDDESRETATQLPYTAIEVLSSSSSSTTTDVPITQNLAAKITEEIVVIDDDDDEDDEGDEGDAQKGEVKSDLHTFYHSGDGGDGVESISVLSSDEEDYKPNLDALPEFRKQIMIGSGFQATIPQLEPLVNGAVTQPTSAGELIWDPCQLSEQEVVAFIKWAATDVNEEDSLAVLHRCQFDVNRALKMVGNENQAQQQMQQWQTEEEEAFVIGLNECGKDFGRILNTQPVLTERRRCIGDLVLHYYLNKSKYGVAKHQNGAAADQLPSTDEQNNRDRNSQSLRTWMCPTTLARKSSTDTN